MFSTFWGEGGSSQHLAYLGGTGCSNDGGHPSPKILTDVLLFTNIPERSAGAGPVRGGPIWACGIGPRAAGMTSGVRDRPAGGSGARGKAGSRSD